MNHSMLRPIEYKLINIANMRKIDSISKWGIIWKELKLNSLPLNYQKIYSINTINQYLTVLNKTQRDIKYLTED